MATDRLLISLNALIVPDWYEIDWEGIPEIIPEVELRKRPSGRDPEMIEKENWSPVIEGVIEKDSFFDRV